VANFFTEGSPIARQAHGSEDAFQVRERIGHLGGTAFEDVLTTLTGHDDGPATVGRLARLPEMTLELSERRLHTESDYLIQGRAASPRVAA
jgi:hypothetical protein